MLKTLTFLALLLFVPVAASAPVGKALVGKYQMDVQGGDILELRADGSAAMAGDETSWSAKGNQLRVGSDVMSYTLQGDRLVLTVGPIQLAWKKISGAGKNSVPTQPTTNPARGSAGRVAEPRGNQQDLEARQTLTSSAWCSFTYNKVSGTSTTRKVVFHPNGVLSINGGAETYSSGYGGTYAGQSNSAGSMRWKLERLRLFVDQGDGTGFQDVGLSATKNSNGYVILHAEGREYSMCN